MSKRSSAAGVENWRSAWGSMMGVSSLRRLRLGCSFVPSTQPENWFGVAPDPRSATITQFELNYGLEQARTEYNMAGLKEARRTRQTYVGHREGFADLFVPAVRDDTVLGVLVCGPVLERQPSGESLKDTWQRISGAPVDPDSSMFLRFVRGTLDCHLFEGVSLELLVSHVEHVASVMAGSKPPRRHDMKGWIAFRQRVPEVGMWDLASELVDSEANAGWMASYRSTDLAQEGLDRIPNYVMSVAPFWPDVATLDTPELMLRTHEFQRACAALAVDLPNTIAGRIGAEAAFFLTHIDAASKDRGRSRLLALGERVRRLLRRKLKTEVVCGFSDLAVHGGELPDRYDEALWAVFWGLHKNRTMTFHRDAGPQDRSTTTGLYRSSRVLYESFARGERRGTEVAAQSVVKDVLWISSGSLEVMRSHFLQILWELLALTERRDVVDKRTSSDMQTEFTLRLKKARATHEVTNSFTLLVHELLDMLERPGKLGRRAKLERARRLVELALLETGGAGRRLDLESVAARVGMSRSSFAAAFRSTYRTTFGAFVLHSRIERSKQLLRGGKLRAAQVSSEAGWSSPSYFHQAFKRVTGTTPDLYKQSSA
ncbi:MAG TPA: AraC family transcriptional regulator [Polyangiaceae bacterium]|nr:AraC family transcriptional regulator [Polyangiaceae bacterium]